MVQFSLYVSFLIHIEGLEFCGESCTLCSFRTNTGEVAAIFQEFLFSESMVLFSFLISFKWINYLPFHALYSSYEFFCSYIDINLRF